MAKVINFPAKNKSGAPHVATANPSSVIETAARLGEIPIIGHALFLLAIAGSESGLKLTQTGALSRKFVQAFWDKFLAEDDKRFRPTREFECPEATRIHQLLVYKKYVRRFKGAVKLTPSGLRVLDDGPTLDFYRDLLMAGIYGWNWAFEDRFPDYDFIQASAHGMIERLWSWPTQALTAVEFTEEIFEKVDENGKAIRMKYDASAPYSSDTYEGMVRCLNLRFFERFCVPFGILRDPSEPRLMSHPTDPFEKTEFFISSFPKFLSR